MLRNRKAGEAIARMVVISRSASSTDRMSQCRNTLSSVVGLIHDERIVLGGLIADSTIGLLAAQQNVVLQGALSWHPSLGAYQWRLFRRWSSPSSTAIQRRAVRAYLVVEQTGVVKALIQEELAELG